MKAAKGNNSRSFQLENQPRRTLLLFGLTPAYGLGGTSQRPSGVFIHCDPDRLLLPITNEFEASPHELSTEEIAAAAHDAIAR